MWWEWRYRHIYPYAGGWCEQPLPLLVKFQAFELVYLAYTSNEKGDGYALDKLNATQSDVVVWLESDG